jgi:hypothetical protein
MDKATFRKIAEQAAANLKNLSGAEAVAVKDIYLTWREAIGLTVKKGFKFTYEGRLYEVIQPDGLTIQGHYIPGEGTEALYAEVNETNAGTYEDPIPYNNNMQLYNGKYYIQDGVIYKCTRDSGQPLYNALKDLVGIYVEIALE